MAESPAQNPSSPNEAPALQIASAPRPKVKATKSLPTDRIQFDRQIEILRAYALASGIENKPVTNQTVGELVKMTAGTISLANAFFTENGLLIKATDGGYTPSAEVINFNRACEWNPESAGAKLGPLIAKTWFASSVLPTLRLRGSLSEEDAVALLADASGAGTHHRNSLRLLIDYMVKSGIVESDGQALKAVRTEAAPTTGETPAAGGASANVVTLGGGAPFAPGAEGAVSFSVNLNVKMSDFAGWEPARIAAFFNGIAATLAAKGKE